MLDPDPLGPLSLFRSHVVQIAGLPAYEDIEPVPALDSPTHVRNPEPSIENHAARRPVADHGRNEQT